MRFGTSRRQESRSATGWSITTTEDRIPRLTISRRASSMLGFGLCLWQHNVGSQIPPYVCCRTVQRMGSTSPPQILEFKRFFEHIVQRAAARQPVAIGEIPQPSLTPSRSRVRGVLDNLADDVSPRLCILCKLAFQ